MDEVRHVDVDVVVVLVAVVVVVTIVVEDVPEVTVVAEVLPTLVLLAGSVTLPPGVGELLDESVSVVVVVELLALGVVVATDDV